MQSSLLLDVSALLSPAIRVARMRSSASDHVIMKSRMQSHLPDSSLHMQAEFKLLDTLHD